MLVISPGNSIEIPFIYKSGYTYSDPLQDIYVYLKRGYGTAGPIIYGPLKFDVSLISGSTPSTSQKLSEEVTVERLSQGSYVLYMKTPSNLYEGKYTIQISTIYEGTNSNQEYHVQVLKPIEKNEETYSPLDKKIVINKKSKYRDVASSETNNLLLIGHTNAINPFSIHKLGSIQDGINLLRADYESPLLRGVFDAYSSGARDIYIMSAGYMSEYQPDVELRNAKAYKDNSATPNLYSFYELYNMKLELCYEILRDYEFIDIIVPLEASFIDCGEVNFASQLASHCDYVQGTTGEVVIGVLGSRSINTISQNIEDLKTKDFEIFSDVEQSGIINFDTGKYLILIYGEAIFNHKQMQRSYPSSVSAAFAGTLASTRVDYGISKKRIPAALSIYGSSLTKSQEQVLIDKNINYLINSLRSRRGNIYDVSISGDLTQSISQNYLDSSNIRLVAMIIQEVQSIGRNAIGKFSHDSAIRNVDSLLLFLKQADIIRDYKFDAIADRLDKGKLYFTINITSSRTLRSISFNIATGRGA